jgi:hypothetical protein
MLPRVEVGNLTAGRDSAAEHNLLRRQNDSAALPARSRRRTWRTFVHRPRREIILVRNIGHHSGDTMEHSTMPAGEAVVRIIQYSASVLGRLRRLIQFTSAE